MRRRLLFLFAWAAATAVAVAGSWVGLQPVLAAATPVLPTALSASQLRETAATAASPSPTPSPTSSPTPVAPPQTASPVPAPPERPASSQWEEIRSGTWERTFVLRGGDVVVEVDRRSVEVVSHTPNPGYEAKITRWTRGSVIVAFHNQDEQTSRVWIMWRNGPYAEVTETV